MLPKRRKPDGFSLIELLIVIALMGILAGMVLPSSQASLHDQLRAAARILQSDLAYARSLAVTNGSNYKVTFEADENRYCLEHSGSNPALEVLPKSPFREAGDTDDEHFVVLDELPNCTAAVRLVTAAESTTSLDRVDDVEFGPLGETTRSGSTIIWLGAGSGEDARYISVTINPLTGLAEIGDFTATGPPAWLLPDE